MAKAKQLDYSSAQAIIALAASEAKRLRAELERGCIMDNLSKR